MEKNELEEEFKCKFKQLSQRNQKYILGIVEEINFAQYFQAESNDLIKSKDGLKRIKQKKKKEGEE